MDFVTVIRASHCHPHSITKEQQHKGKPQAVDLSILRNSEGGSLFPNREQSSY